MTVTSAVPDPAGDFAEHDVDVEQLTLVPAALPNLTVASLAKFDPTIVTVVPPAAGPAPGLTEVTVGAP